MNRGGSTLDYQNILYEKSDHIAKITLNQPEKRNPLSDAMTRELTLAFQEAQADSEVRVIVVTGSGDSFCAGGDLREFSQYLDWSPVDLHESGKEMTRLFQMAGSIRKPVLAGVNGYAFGGGCGLVAFCHMAIASERAKLGLTEIRLGLFPLVILPVVRRAIGDRKTLELALTGKIIDAHEAAQIGLVNQVVPHDELDETVMELARSMAGRSPIAFKIGLEAFNETTDVEFVRAFDYLNTLRVITFKSEDLREGARAFLEKREPQWKGR